MLNLSGVAKDNFKAKLAIDIETQKLFRNNVTIIILQLN